MNEIIIKDMTLNEFYLFSKIKNLDQNYKNENNKELFKKSLPLFFDIDNQKEINEFSLFLKKEYNLKELSLFFINNTDNLIFYFYMKKEIFDKDDIDFINKYINDLEPLYFDHIKDSSIDIEYEIFKFKHFYEYLFEFSKKLYDEQKRAEPIYFERMFFFLEKTLLKDSDFLYFRSIIVKNENLSKLMVDKGMPENVTYFDFHNKTKKIFDYMNKHGDIVFDKFLNFYYTIFHPDSMYNSQADLFFYKKFKELSVFHEHYNAHFSYLNITIMFDSVLSSEQITNLNIVFGDQCKLNVFKDRLVFNDRASFFSEFTWEDYSIGDQFFKSVTEFKSLSTECVFFNFLKYYLLNDSFLFLKYHLTSFVDKSSVKELLTFLDCRSYYNVLYPAAKINDNNALFFPEVFFITDFYKHAPDLLFAFLNHTYMNKENMYKISKEYHEKKCDLDIVSWIFSRYPLFFTEKVFFIKDFLFFENKKYLTANESVVIFNMKELDLNTESEFLYYNYKSLNDSIFSIPFFELVIEEAKRQGKKIKRKKREQFCMPPQLKTSLYYFEKYGVPFYQHDLFFISSYKCLTLYGGRYVSKKDIHTFKINGIEEYCKFLKTADYLSFKPNGEFTEDCMEIIILNNSK